MDKEEKISKRNFKIIKEFNEWWKATQYMREWSIKLQAGLAWTNGWMIALEMKDMAINKLIKKIITEAKYCPDGTCGGKNKTKQDCINCVIEWAEKEINKEGA